MFTADRKPVGPITSVGFIADMKILLSICGCRVCGCRVCRRRCISCVELKNIPTCILIGHPPPKELAKATLEKSKISFDALVTND